MPISTDLDPAVGQKLAEVSRLATQKFLAKDYLGCSRAYGDGYKLAARSSSADIWLFNTIVCTRQAGALNAGHELDSTVADQPLQVTARPHRAALAG